MNLKSKIESILLVSSKPIEAKKIAKLTDAKTGEVAAALEELKQERNSADSGIHLIEQSGKYQLVTNPANAATVDSLVKEEVSGELTRPSLETLTIIAYRGPITKPEIEQIRGINCSVILRNLLMRGLIEERDDPQRLQPVYSLTADFIRHLGIHSVEELPRYAELSVSEELDQALEPAREAVAAAEPTSDDIKI